ncbi:MAG: hypothetical protein EP307_04350 [Rhodobacteraceae bacterium]|nr:MAG: hypothetical protein EP307_04350 [Paracoccaceae bacterium]
MRWIVPVILLLACPAVLRADGHAELGLSAPAEIEASGLLAHVLPRFSLKTGLRVTASPEGSMELAAEPPGTPVFQRGEVLYYLRPGADARAQRFADWLTSEIGLRTVEGFLPPDGIGFTAPRVVAVTAVAPEFDGDAAEGRVLSHALCGRCHVIGPENALSGIGSTPSFAVLRALPDWDARFQAFFALRPHPAFTQVAGVTEPFDPARPSPIVPVEMTMEDLGAILAFVAALEAADLGAPLHLQ